MTDFVTGATGFVGMRLCAWLKQRGRSVRAALRPGRGDDGKAERLRALGVEVLPLDLADGPAVTAALAGVDTLYHLAWKSHRMTQNPAGMPVASPAEDNLEALGYLIDGAKSAAIRRFVFTSTVSVYGPEHAWGPTPQREDTPLPALDRHPNPYFRFYAAAKAQAERILKAACPPPDYVIVRPAMVYGAGAQFAPKMVGDALSGRGAGPVPHAVQWVHVDDLVEALMRAAELDAAANETFNIAGEAAILNHTIAGEIRRLAAPRQDALVPPEPLDWNPRVPRYDIRAAQALLGFRPRIGWREGLAEMVAAEAGSTARSFG